jgi:hypothetical protein
MTFRSDEPPNAAATAFQFQVELVVGNARRGYILDDVTFDRVGLSGKYEHP